MMTDPIRFPAMPEIQDVAIALVLVLVIVALIERSRR